MGDTSTVTQLVIALFTGTALTAIGTAARDWWQARAARRQGLLEHDRFDEERRRAREARITELEARNDALEDEIDQERRDRRTAEDERDTAVRHNRSLTTSADFLHGEIARLTRERDAANARADELQQHFDGTA